MHNSQMNTRKPQGKPSVSFSVPLKEHSRNLCTTFVRAQALRQDSSRPRCCCAKRLEKDLFYQKFLAKKPHKRHSCRRRKQVDFCIRNKEMPPGVTLHPWGHLPCVWNDRCPLHWLDRANDKIIRRAIAFQAKKKSKLAMNGTWKLTTMGRLFFWSLPLNTRWHRWMIISRLMFSLFRMMFLILDSRHSEFSNMPCGSTLMPRNTKLQRQLRSISWNRSCKKQNEGLAHFPETKALP